MLITMSCPYKSTVYLYRFNALGLTLLCVWWRGCVQVIADWNFQCVPTLVLWNLKNIWENFHWDINGVLEHPYYQICMSLADVTWRQVKEGSCK